VLPVIAFLRLLGLVYVAAFASLAVQIRGLVGSRGISPASEFLELVRTATPHPFWSSPSIFWINASDGALVAVCWIGAALGALVAAGLLQGPALVLLWALFLSVCTVGQEFLGFQWDALLLETGFLAVFLAPWTVFSWRQRAEPSVLVTWLLRFLLFRLMFASGVVKLASGDPTWRNLTALQFHYETQPLPTWTSFFAQQLPAWFQSFSTLVMFAVELISPFGIFAPRRFRLASFCALVGLQLGIAETGNYAYFNLLTVALCLLLLDDACFPAGWRPAAAVRVAPPWRGYVAWAFAGVWLLLSVSALLRSTFHAGLVPAPVRWIERTAAPFQTINRYGLFAVMTTTRPEIIVEGSADGVAWRRYEFKYKPGDLKRRPAFVAPYQPRLDWQMWFAALGSWQDNPWFTAFLRRLTEGSPDVLALLEHDPFAGHPPRFVRATVYRYQFTDLATWRATGAWWRAEALGRYSPTLEQERSE
jgi:hypothetical protein